MKKTVLAIGLVLALSLSAAASFEFYGGGSYNTFDPEELNEFIKEINEVLEEWEGSDTVDDLTKAEEIKSGFGAFGGVRYWVNPTMAVGGEIEYFGAKSEASVSAEVEAEAPQGYDVDVTKAEDLKSAFGAFGGVRYWVNPTMAVGGEVEYFGAKSEGSVEVTGGEGEGVPSGSIDASVSASVTGFSGAGAFKASPELTVFASAGYYYLNGEVAVKDDDLLADFGKGINASKAKFSDKGLGFKAGVAFAYPIADELSIVGRAAYRSLKFDEIEFDDDDDRYGLEEDVEEIDALADEEIDFSGLEVGLGIVYSF